MSEVAAIDRENKLWRLVDANEGVDANMQRLVAAGVSVAEIEKFKPRLIELWGDIDPSLQIDWLDQKTLAKIEALKPDYVIPMRRARINHELYRLGAENLPVTPDGIKSRWRDAIWSILDLDQREKFTLMNSARAIALSRLIKDLPTTTQERLSLCQLQQDSYRDKFSPDGNTPAQIIVNGKQAWLHYWQNMRDLLGDERFANYMRKSDAGFGRMSFVLDQITGMNGKMVLDFWWIRKKDELEDARTPGELSHFQRKMEIYDSAAAVLGSNGMIIYLADDDSKWLERKPAPQMGETRVAMEIPGFLRKSE